MGFPSSGLVLSLVCALSACGSPPAPSSRTSSAERLLLYGPENNGPIGELTPGHLCSEDNPHFDGYRYGGEVAHCSRSVSVTRKIAVAASYGIPADQRHKYQIDHFIPLNIGGSNSTSNLWPLIVPLAREKSVYEGYLMEQVRRRRMTQSEAIAAIKAWRPGHVW